MAELLQNYKGGTCKMCAYGTRDPVVNRAAFAIISGNESIPERMMEIAAVHQNTPQIAKGKDGNSIG